MTIGGKIRLKPAFRNTEKLPNALEDYKAAANFGPIMVGEEALYLYDFDMFRYIPLGELSSIEVDLGEAGGGSGCRGGSCNVSGICSYEVRITDCNGEVFRTLVINPEKIDRAVENILTKQPALRYQVK